MKSVRKTKMQWRKTFLWFLHSFLTYAFHARLGCLSTIQVTALTGHSNTSKRAIIFLWNLFRHLHTVYRCIPKPSTRRSRSQTFCVTANLPYFCPIIWMKLINWKNSGREVGGYVEDVEKVNLLSITENWNLQWYRMLLFLFHCWLWRFRRFSVQISPINSTLRYM